MKYLPYIKEVWPVYTSSVEGMQWKDSQLTLTAPREGGVVLKEKNMVGN